MGRLKRYLKSMKSTSEMWSEGICKDLDELGFSYDRNSIKRYYKKLKIKTEYMPGISIEKELDKLKESKLIKPNLKKLLMNNKKKCSDLVFELHKNKHLLLLNDSMIELSYKECFEIEEKRKDKEYHFEFLFEDLNLQVFYEERKLQELRERLELLYNRIGILENIIKIKRSTNSIIEVFMKDFHSISNDKTEMYQYEIEASNILNEKKYTEDEITNDNEDLESTNYEKDEIDSSVKKTEKTIELLMQQIIRVKEIIDLKSDDTDRIEKTDRKKRLLTDSNNKEE